MDIKFSNYVKDVYDKVKKLDSEFIPIGLDESCHYAFYFANKYNKLCKALFLINNRRINKKNYMKSLDRGRRAMQLYFGKGYEKFFDDINDGNLSYILKKGRIKNTIIC